MDDFGRWAMCQAHLYNAVSSLKAAINYLTAADDDEFGEDLMVILNALENVTFELDGCDD